MEIKKVLCKSILSKSGLYDSKYSINPYRGCSNSCIYCITPNTVVLTENGFTKIKDLKSTKVLSHEGYLRPLSNHFFHKYKGKMIVLKPVYFEELSLTPNHKVFAVKRKDLLCIENKGVVCFPNKNRKFVKNNKIIDCRYCTRKKINPSFIPAGNLQEGDFVVIPVPKDIKDFSYISVSKVLSEHKKKHKKKRKLPIKKIENIFILRKIGLSERSIAKKLKISSTSVHKYLQGESKDHEYEVGIIKEGNYVRFKGGKVKIPDAIQVNTDFMRLVGYYLAEGCISISSNRPNSAYIAFTFNENEKDYISDVKTLLNKIFKITPNIIYDKNNKTVHIHSGAAILAFFFAKLFEKSSEKMRIPPEFLYLPQQKQKELIKGLLRGDGSVNPKAHKPICLETTSPDLRDSVRFILLRLGIINGFDKSIGGKKTKNTPYCIRPAPQFRQEFADLFEINAKVKNKSKFSADIVDNRFIITPIWKIKIKEYNGIVYNLGVDKDNSYTANFIAISNCYAPYVLREGRKWGSFVDVKTNASEVLEKEIRKNNSGNVLVSSVTDPYQPLERKYEITKKILEKLKNTKLFVSILTKSALVTRDIDLLKQLNCEVGLTITTLNDNIRKIFEPNASSVEDRINALKQLKDAGIKTYIFFGPMLPYISDRNLEETLKKLAELKPEKIYFDKLNIKHPYQWSKIKAVLEENYADLADKWQSAISNEEYYKELKEKIITICKNLNLNYEFCY